MNLLGSVKQTLATERHPLLKRLQMPLEQVIFENTEFVIKNR
jgi:hypothetical protein